MIIKWFEKQRKLSFLITIIIAIMIYYASSIQGTGTGTGSTPWIPTLYHITAFFFLAAFTMITIINGKNGEFFVPVILLTLFYALLDETHQLFVPGRHFSLFDILLDGIGIFSAFIIYLTILIVRRK